MRRLLSLGTPTLLTTVFLSAMAFVALYAMVVDGGEHRKHERARLACIYRGWVLVTYHGRDYCRDDDGWYTPAPRS